MSKKAEGFSIRFVLINTGNISRKVLSKVLRSFDKNFERLQLRCRLLDMGLIPKTVVEIRKVAPMGDPIELEIRGYTLTIRKEDAAKIEVTEDMP